MSGPELPRLILLRLPSTGAGTTAFTHDLQAEAATVERALRADGGVTDFDPLRAAVRLLGPVPPARVYALSGVASIGTTDVAGDARSDVLHALAQAAFVTRHKEVSLDGSHRWTGYLLQWDGQTILVGRGERGKAARLQLPLSKNRRVVRHVEADPSNGAYAIDLGSMSQQQASALFSNLRRENTHRTPAKVAPVPRLPRPSRGAVRRRVSSSDASGPFLVFALLAAVVAAAVLVASRRWRGFAACR
jgi:hypothetical protein